MIRMSGNRRKVLLALCCILQGGCAAKPSEGPAAETAQPQETPHIEGCKTIHETEFGGVYIGITIDEFNALGFDYGDSVDVVFSNGYVMEDIPYYNGYYVDAGNPLLIAYPGYDYIKAAVNYGDDLWETAALQGTLGGPKVTPLWVSAGLQEHDTASVILREKGKYREIQTARDIHYTDLRKDYPDDETFANFRSFAGGTIRQGMLYRSASPCDNQHNRAPYTDKLISEAGVRFILNLSDNDVKIERYIGADDFASPYFQSLYDEGNVEAIALSMNYQSEEFAQKIVQGFRAMAQSDGPYLVHCTEGKDRTGFVCMLIEALAGASYQEIADDYMLTYANYYKITESSYPIRYKAILEANLVPMMKYIIADENTEITSADLSQCARNYLRSAEMSDAEIDAFLEKITK